jgi:hypothetical protein
VLLAVLTQFSAHAEPEASSMHAVLSDTPESQQIVSMLQSALFTLNPDAVILWCPEVRVTADGRRAGASCRILDGVVPRRALLCLNVARGHFALRYVESPVALNDDQGLLTFIGQACPADE